MLTALRAAFLIQPPFKVGIWPSCPRAGGGRLEVVVDARMGIGHEVSGVRRRGRVVLHDQVRVRVIGVVRRDVGAVGPGIFVHTMLTSSHRVRWEVSGHPRLRSLAKLEVPQP